MPQLMPKLKLILEFSLGLHNLSREIEYIISENLVKLLELFIETLEEYLEYFKNVAPNV